MIHPQYSEKSLKHRSTFITPDLLEATRYACFRAVHYEKNNMSALKLKKIIPGSKARRKSFSIEVKIIGKAFKSFAIPELKKKKQKIQYLSLQKLPAITKPRPSLSIEELTLDAYKEFLTNIRLSNGLRISPNENRYFKCFVGSGNNSALVKQILARRWWWISEENCQNANFIWTSLKHRQIMNALKPSKVNLTSKDKSFYCKTHLAKTHSKYGHELILNNSHFKAFDLLSDYSPSNTKLYNKIMHSKQICSKSGLFINMKKHYGRNTFRALPLSFLVRNGLDDENFQSFVDEFRSSKEIWILKPAENTNRGNGICISSDLDEISKWISSSKHSFIIQKYISNPLLLDERKFDIRVFGLVTCINGRIQAYFYKEGYVRTSSTKFSLSPPFTNDIHLTNDAVQKKLEDYGKYESGNKLSFQELDEAAELDFYQKFLPRIREIVQDTVKATADKLDPTRRAHTFELIGYDFMIDQEFNVWLIEANSNPCLELSSSYLEIMIPELIDNTFLIVLDPLFPPPGKPRNHSKNKFELIFST